MDAVALLKSVLERKDESVFSQNFSSVNTFWFRRFLSTVRLDTCVFANEFLNNQYITSEEMAKILFHAFPKMKAYGTPLKKPEKEFSDEEKQKILELANLLEISSKEIKMFLNHDD